MKASTGIVIANVILVIAIFGQIYASTQSSTFSKLRKNLYIESTAVASRLASLIDENKELSKAQVDKVAFARDSIGKANQEMTDVLNLITSQEKIIDEAASRTNVFQSILFAISLVALGVDFYFLSLITKEKRSKIV